MGLDVYLAVCATCPASRVCQTVAFSQANYVAMATVDEVIDDGNRFCLSVRRWDAKKALIAAMIFVLI